MFKSTPYTNEGNCLNLLSERVRTMRTSVGDSENRLVINKIDRTINTTNLKLFSLQAGDLITFGTIEKTVNVHRHTMREAQVFNLKGVNLELLFNSKEICNLESLSADFNNSPYWYLYDVADIQLLKHRALRVISKNNKNMFLELIKAKNDRVHINLYRYKKYRKVKLNIISCNLIDLANLVSTLGEQATFDQIRSTYFN